MPSKIASLLLAVLLISSLAARAAGGEAIAAAPGRDGLRAPGLASGEVVAEHGDVRLLVTGSCGPGGKGRRAVVVSAVPHEPVRVTVETSLWIAGRPKSTSEETLTLPPLGERELGCTRLSDATEKRFALAWVSNAASHPRHRLHAAERPAREMVAIVAGSTCGRQRAGRRQAAINRHSDLAVALDVQIVERVAGRETRRFVRSLRLAPGDEKRLGCSAAGRLTRELTVLRAEYR